MSKKYILSLDQGTTSSRAILYDQDGKNIAMSQKELTQYYPKPGWVEHDPIEIFTLQREVENQVIEESGVKLDEIGAIGIANQRETTVVWDKHTGQPIYNAIVWQCRRTAPICDALKAQGFENYIKENTGLMLDPYFSGTKLKWILDHVPGAREKGERGDLLFGTIDTWLLWKYTEGAVHKTDYSNAARTMLFNINTLSWDETILKQLDIPAIMLPKVSDSSGVFGYPTHYKEPIPIAALIGDQQGALFGHGCFEPGNAKNTYGTGCFMLMNIGQESICSKNGLLTTIGWKIGDQLHYVLEGSVFSAGSIIQWLRDELNLLQTAGESERMAKSVKDTHGAHLIPAFTGLGAPYWDSEVRGALVGLTRGVNKNHIVRAALLSIAYQTKDLMLAMEEDAGIKLNALKVDGGATSNQFLMEEQAHLLGMEISKPSNNETTALGAAYLAGLAIGFWKDFESLKKKSKASIVFKPSSDNGKTIEAYLEWKKAVKGILKMSSDESL